MSLPSMIFRGQSPLRVIRVNDSLVFGIYSDVITHIKHIKYREIDNNTNMGWSRIKTPQNLMWLIKKFNGANEDVLNIINPLYNIYMTSKNNIPLKVFPINGEYILGVYKGNISEFDLLIKYRQLVDNNWSGIRTPKHIHWAVDVLIKMSLEETKTKEFIDFLIDYWDNIVTPLRSINERDFLLSNDLLAEVNSEATSYYELVGKGEYSVKFLLLIAKLLMYQEKTNLDTAYMFKNLLEALKDGGNIFKIISIATHNRR